MSNLPAKFTTRQKNQFVQEFIQGWGAKSEGIEPGHFVRGIILGFEVNDFNGKNIILRTIPEESNERAVRLRVYGCGSLMKQLHQEQQAPFNTLIYNVGDVVEITFTGSFIANKGPAKGKTIANFTLHELVGYEFTEQDLMELEKYRLEEAYKQPTRIIKAEPQNQKQQKGFVHTRPVQQQSPKIEGKYVNVVQDDDDTFDI